MDPSYFLCAVELDRKVRWEEVEGKEHGVRRRVCVSIEVCRRPQEGKQECTDGELEKAAVNAARFSSIS